MTNNGMKESLLLEIDKRVSDKVLEPTNAELLKKLILAADDDNEAMMIAALGTTYKKTGFHFDKRLERLSNDIRYFKKNEALSFHTDDSKPTHKLIIGDNYEALQNLLIEYKGRVDVIYIDPPYGKDSMGEFAQTNYENAITRDNLLSMLYPRLMLAKQLLAESGVIFCSIDDRNQAYIKCLFDEVFLEKNFISNIIWRKQGGGKADSSYLANNCEYVITYKKASLEKFNGNEIDETIFNKTDDNGRKYRLMSLDFGSLSYSVSLDYPITLPNGIVCYPDCEKTYNERKKGKVNSHDWCWRCSKEEYEKRLNAGKIEFTYNKRTGKWKVQERLYLDEKKEGGLRENIITEFTNRTAKNQLKSIFQDVVFNYPKPIDLCQFLINLYPKKNIIVLDFFAGSGTTGHAVLDMNKKDEGNRQFILCQLNEKTDTTPNGIAYDVTSKRLKRVMTGECYDGTKSFKWAEENTPYGGNLDVYEIATVHNSNNIEGQTPFDVIDETLYGREKFTTLREKVDWVCGNFAHTQKWIDDNDWLDKHKLEG